MQISFYPMQAIAVQPPGSREETWYPSMVLDYHEGESLSIATPLNRRQEVLIRPGTRVRMQLALPDGLRRFTALVRARNTTTPPSLELDWPDDVQRIQRREFVRVDITLRAQVRRVLDGGALGPPYTGITTDLSAGGVRLRLAAPIELLATTEILFFFPANVTHRCQGRIVRRGELTQALTDLRHWMAFQFTDIGEDVRRAITRLVFDVQREQIKRGTE